MDWASYYGRDDRTRSISQQTAQTHTYRSTTPRIQRTVPGHSHGRSSRVCSRLAGSFFAAERVGCLVYPRSRLCHSVSGRFARPGWKRREAAGGPSWNWPLFRRFCTGTGRAHRRQHSSRPSPPQGRCFHGIGYRGEVFERARSRMHQHGIRRTLENVSGFDLVISGPAPNGCGPGGPTGSNQLIFRVHVEQHR